MNKFFLSLLACVLFLLASAQSPQAIPYQAVARNSNGNLIASQNVAVRFTIHDLTTNGATVYQERHATTTSALGLFNVNVGTGTVLSGTFNTIDWGSGAKFMQVELDPAGTAYTDMGTSQMLSVPYALYAQTSGNGQGPTGPTGPTGNDGATGATGSGGSLNSSGSAVTWGAAAITQAAAVPIASLSVTNPPAPASDNAYAQTMDATGGNNAEVVNGITSSITVGSSSTVLVLANIGVKTTSISSTGSLFRYALWLQRATDAGFTTGLTTIYKIEDGIASGNTYSGSTSSADFNGQGISNTNIMFPDVNLSAGTYYYRIVFHSLFGGPNNAVLPVPTIQDRSMTLVQIK